MVIIGSALAGGAIALIVASLGAEHHLWTLAAAVNPYVGLLLAVLGAALTVVGSRK
jgi:hypothetical protein